MNRAGISQNTARINSALKPGAYRVPDYLSASKLIEVKNVMYQPFTSQLRDYAAICERDNLICELRINSGARLSGPLEDSGLFNVVRY